MSTNPLEGEPLALYQSSRSILTRYEPGSKSFFHNFTPGYPPYPPHGVSYEYFNKSARRTRGLLWSRDGRSWNRRHVVAPGEHDLPGASFHFFGFIHPAGHMESDTGEQLCLGAVLRYNLTQTQFQDGVWSRDKIHWGRFGKSRMSHLWIGPVGTFDASFANHVSGYYSMPDAHGEKACWFPYLGNQARYMLVAARDAVKNLCVGLRNVGLRILSPFSVGPLFHELGGLFRGIASFGLVTHPVWPDARPGGWAMSSPTTAAESSRLIPWFRRAIGSSSTLGSRTEEVSGWKCKTPTETSSPVWSWMDRFPCPALPWRILPGGRGQPAGSVRNSGSATGRFGPGPRLRFRSDYSILTDTLAKRTSTSPRRHEFVKDVSKTRKISPGSISTMSV